MDLGGPIGRGNHPQRRLLQRREYGDGGRQRRHDSTHNRRGEHVGESVERHDLHSLRSLVHWNEYRDRCGQFQHDPRHDQRAGTVAALLGLAW